MLISYHTIGRNIRSARQQAGLTQEALAERLRISHLHFGRLERGERPISLELLAHIASTLGASLNSLLSGCVVTEAMDLRPDSDADAFAASLAEMATGCTPRCRRLMLAVCRDIVEAEKLAPDARE